MKCYHVTFELQRAGRKSSRTISFYADTACDLAEQLLEYEEDLDHDGFEILDKCIQEIPCR